MAKQQDQQLTPEKNDFAMGHKPVFSFGQKPALNNTLLLHRADTFDQAELRRIGHDAADSRSTDIDRGSAFQSGKFNSIPSSREPSIHVQKPMQQATNLTQIEEKNENHEDADHSTVYNSEQESQLTKFSRQHQDQFDQRDQRKSQEVSSEWQNIAIMKGSKNCSFAVSS